MWLLSLDSISSFRQTGVDGIQAGLPPCCFLSAGPLLGPHLKDKPFFTIATPMLLWTYRHRISKFSGRLGGGYGETNRTEISES